MNPTQRSELALRLVKAPQFMAAVFISLALGLWFLTPEKSNDDKADGPALALDQLIPSGMQLVPIIVANPAALHALMDNYGIVDLYLGSQRIARGVKILRGIHQAEQFSILVPEEKVPMVVAHDEPYRVVIRNRGFSGTSFEVRKSHRGSANTIAVEALGGESL